MTTMEHLSLTIEGMTCEHCLRAVRGRLEQTPGVKVGDVSIGSATLDFDPESRRASTRSRKPSPTRATRRS